MPLSTPASAPTSSGDAFIEDQSRECERVAKAAGLEVVARFENKGISGGTASRPGYQALLARARTREFEVIITEDISRLWRNRAECGPRSAELEDIGVHCLTLCLAMTLDGTGGVLLFRSSRQWLSTRDARRRIEHGAARKVRPSQGNLPGGGAYGYVAAAQSSSGQVEVDGTQAAIVQRIFELCADGVSPRKIAAHLNAEHVSIPLLQLEANEAAQRWQMACIDDLRPPKRGSGHLKPAPAGGAPVTSHFCRPREQQRGAGAVPPLQEQLAGRIADGDRVNALA